MYRNVWLVRCAAALTLAGGAALRARPLPRPGVDELCVRAELIIEGEHLGNDRVKIVRVYKTSDRLDGNAAEIVVQHVDKYVRVLTRPRAATIQTNKLVLFLTYQPETRTWRSLYTTDQEGQWGSAGLFWFDDQTCYGYTQPSTFQGYALAPGNDGRPKRFRVPKDIHDMRARIQLGMENLRRWQAVLAVKDPAQQARQMARYLLPRTAPKGYKSAFRVELRHRLAELGRHAVPVLIDVVKNAKPDERLNDAVLILYDIGVAARPAVPLLCELLESPRNTSRYYVLSALRTAGDPAAIPYVRPMLEVADTQVAANAAKTLAAFGDHESFDAIAAVLPLKFNRDDLVHARDLLHALHTLDPKRARPLIERVASDPAFANRRDFLVPR